MNQTLYKVYPIDRNLTAHIIFLRLKTLSNHCFILESASQKTGDNNNRWTFIGWDPTHEYTLNNYLFKTTNLTNNTTKTSKINNSPNEILRDIMNSLRTENTIPDNPPFFGGLMGYYAFEYIKYFEPTLQNVFDKSTNTEEFNDFDLMLFDKVIIIDNLKQVFYIVYNVFDDFNMTQHSTYSTEDDVMHKIDETYEFLIHSEVTTPDKLQVISEAEELLPRPRFTGIIRKAKEHIIAGNIFQVVLSNRLKYLAKGSLFSVYQKLCINNPSPYMFYLSSDNIEIAGASPETLVDLKISENNQRITHTYPLAGTRPRGNNTEDDANLERELLHDQKELAEHNMLVDLGRNDLGKVCMIGSVNVLDYMHILRFSHVMHIGSKVEGILKDNYNAFDLIEAVLPAGTLSGAPKIRACEIISELEGDTRGIYGGCLGYFSLSGEMDMCITIRSAYKRGDVLYARSGAGIVLDSDPDSEYTETKHKIQSIVSAIDTLDSCGGGQ